MPTKKPALPLPEPELTELDCPARSLIRQYIEAMHREARIKGCPYKLQRKIEQEVLSFFS